MSLENPKKISIQEMLQNTERILADYQSEAIEKLKPFVSRNLAPGEIFAYFEIFDLDTYALAYNKASLITDETGAEKIDIDFAPAFSGEVESFIPKLNEYLSQIFENTEFSEGESQNFTKDHEDLIFKWFGVCWEKAGGKESKIPTYFCFGPTYGEVKDIFTGEVLTEDQAAKKSGVIINK